MEKYGLEDDKEGASIVAQWSKLPPIMLAFHPGALAGVPAALFPMCSLPVCLGRQQRMAEVHGILPPRWET